MADQSNIDTYSPFRVPVQTPMFSGQSVLARVWIEHWMNVARKAGRSLTWRGTWDSSMQYAVNEAVASTDGQYLWRAVQANTDSEPSLTNTAWDLIYGPTPGSIGITIGLGTETPATGSKGYLQIPCNCTITGWTILADQSGSAQITVAKCAYRDFPTTKSIVGSTPPNLNAEQNSTSTSLDGWDTELNAGDVLEFHLDSAATVTRIILQLQVSAGYGFTFAP